MAKANSSSSSIVVLEEAAAVAPASEEWRPKHYVLAGMAVILAASTVTIVTSIILRPAPITFTIDNFTMSGASHTDRTEDNRLVFNFQLVASNPSSRAAVRYRHVVVSLQLRRNATVTTKVRETSVPGNVIGSFPLKQGTRDNVTMLVTGFFDNSYFGIYSFEKKPSTAITVIAQVRFKVGLAESRLYSIKVLCSIIDNLEIHMTPSSANCSAA